MSGFVHDTVDVGYSAINFLDRGPCKDMSHGDSVGLTNVQFENYTHYGL